MYQSVYHPLCPPAQLCPVPAVRGTYTPTHYTPVPHATLDALLPTLRGSEAKVLLYIQRRTLGFGKTADAISLAQFQRGIVTRDGRTLDGGCGVRDRSTLIAALRVLADRGIIVVEHRKGTHGGDLATVYRLVPAANGLASEGGVGFSHGGGVGFSHSQEIALQEKGGDDFDYSKALSFSRDLSPDTDPLPASEIPPSPPRPSLLPTPPPPPPTLLANAPSHLPAPVNPVRVQLTPYVADIARELHDRAKLAASVTRVYRLWQVSGLPVETFLARLLAARAITQERSGAIRDRAPDGQARKFGYFCAVLADQCGLKPHTKQPAAPALSPPIPDNSPLRGTEQAIPADVCDPPAPPRAMPPLPPPAVRNRERAVFWEWLRVETGIGDLRAFAREFDRPPPYPGDAAATVAWVRAQRRRRQ